MYRNILPYNARRDRTVLQGHHDTTNRAQALRLHRLRRQSFKHAIHDGARRIRKAFSRPGFSAHTGRSMSWWD